MLRTLRDLENYKTEATDGEIGAVCDFCFDDRQWTIRYLVVDTGGFWDGDRRVLVSPIFFERADWSRKRFHLALTQDKIKHSPNADLDKPVSRQFENDYYRYYQISPYWGYSGNWNWGAGGMPGALATSAWSSDRTEASNRRVDPHLRSAQAVTGYQITSGADVLGYVTDFIVDDETWAIQYLVVETHKWWFGKKVLVSPRWVDSISWAERSISTSIPRDAIKKSPAWNPTDPVNRSYEMRLYDYYGEPAYWLDTDRAKEEAPLSSSPGDSQRLA